MSRRNKIVLIAILTLYLPLPLFAQADASVARTVRIQAFSLFHPDVMVVTPVPGHGLRFSSGETHYHAVRLRLANGAVNCDGLNAVSISVGNELGGDADFTLSIPGKIERHFRGQLEIHARGQQLVAVVSMDLEVAVAAVVAAESAHDAPPEALKAQAVAARSYFVAGGGRHGKAFDFCDSTHCQLLRAPAAEDSLAQQAAKETRGMVLAYNDRVFASMYSASCGGRTHSLEQLGMKVQDYPYYEVECAYCRRHPEPWVTHIGDEASKSLAQQHTEQARLKLARSLGWNTVPGNTYTVHESEEGVVLSGVGHGHGLGLCQRGAADMARNGATFKQILLHYYPNTTLQQLL